MIQLPSSADAKRLKDFLIRSGFSESGLEEAFDCSTPPERADVPRLLHITAEPIVLNLLTRLFLIGTEVERGDLDNAVPDWVGGLMRDAGLLGSDDQRVSAEVVIIPRGDLLLASDTYRMPGADNVRDFVLPASILTSDVLANLTLRRPVGSTLDLGTGCGIHALLAAAHSEHVVGSDSSQRARVYAEFNARLNGFENVKFAKGDRFGAVTGRRFDLIVTNPPSLPTPGREHADTRLELDDMFQHLVHEAPEYLNEGGFFQMICEWVEVADEPWRLRLKEWFKGTGCDAWVLRRMPQTPAEYVALRLSDTSVPKAKDPKEHVRWMDYFDQHQVCAIHAGLIVMRRRPGGNWLHFHTLGAEVATPAGEAILRSFHACDFLDTHNADHLLLEATLRLSDELRLEQYHKRAEGQWKGEGMRLCLEGALLMDAEVDAAVMALLNEFDGSRSVGDCLEDFAGKAGGKLEELTQQCLPVIKTFVERGFLLP